MDILEFLFKFIGQSMKGLKPNRGKKAILDFSDISAIQLAEIKRRKRNNRRLLEVKCGGWKAI